MFGAEIEIVRELISFYDIIPLFTRVHIHTMANHELFVKFKILVFYLSKTWTQLLVVECDPAYRYKRIIQWQRSEAHWPTFPAFTIFTQKSNVVLIISLFTFTQAVHSLSNFIYALKAHIKMCESGNPASDR